MDFEIFHDQGTGYMSNLEPTEKDSVTLWLRADRGALSKAVIQYSSDGSCWNESMMQRKEQDVTGYYEFWEGVIPPMQERYHYRFYVEGGKEAVYLGTEGMSVEAPICSDCFSVIPGFATPDWAKGIIWYSVMPDSFYNGDVLNDMAESRLRKTVSWGSGRRGLNEYYGGDIKGIISKLDYIKDLGAEGFYVNPMWISDSNAGYGPNNYYETSPNFGNEEDFIELCRQVHGNGMPIMIDAVFSYSQYNSIFTNNNGYQPLPGAFESQESEYSELFRFEKWPGSYVHKWGGIENDLGNDKFRDLLWRKEDSVLKRYLKPPYDANGWRFDAIASYAGTNTSLTEIGADIRKETKAVKPDVLLIGEDYSKDTGMSGNWDSMQNSFFIFSAKLWLMGGQFNQTWLVDRLYKMAKLPRPIALCMYNNFENHDAKWLLAKNFEEEKYRIKAVWLLQMTFVGAPVIYYGAENISGKEENRSTFSCFNWNAEEWNYELRSICKALCELRKEYTALKEGPFKVGLADNERQLTVYGRWDENGTVVTMMNRRDYAQEISLNLKQYNICDGTVLTDYLTGRTYTVEQGFATVDIPAGGSILVTGKAGNYRGRFKLVEAATDSGVMMAENGWKDGSVIMPEENCYFLRGKKQDAKNRMALTPVFGRGYIEAVITKEAVGGALVLKEDIGSRQMSAVFTEHGLAVYGTDNMLLCETVLPGTGSVRLGIKADGCGVVEICQGSYVETVAESVCSFAGAGQLYAGIALWGTYAALSGVQVGQESGPLREDFSGTDLGRMLSAEKMKGCYSVANGELTVKTGDVSMLLCESRASDFTFKIGLESLKNGFAGVISYCDEKNGVVLVRDTAKGDCLVFGYWKDGEIIPYETVTGEFQDGVELQLQLQRIGAVYTAVYVWDGQTKGFSAYLPANMSMDRAGIVCGKGVEAVITYACFGDSIHDGTTVNTPETPGKQPEMNAAAASWTEASVLENYNIIGDSSEWEYALGGIRRNEMKGLSQLAITNRTYGDFKIQCTLLRTGGDGAIGVTMLRSSLGEDLGDGYILSLYVDNMLSVTYEGEVLFEQVISHVSEYGLKLNIIRRADKLYLYAGADNELLACIPNVVRKQGYLGFYLENASGYVNNYMILDTGAAWTEPATPYTQNIREENGALVAQSGEFVMASRKGAAYTHVKVSARIIPDPVEPEKEAYAGFLFAAPYDREPKQNGVLVGIDGTGTVFLSKEGKRMASVSSEGKGVSAYLTVTADAGAYAVYRSETEKPCLVWKDSCHDGGVVSLVSENSRSGFYHVHIEDTTGERQMTADKISDYRISRNGVWIDRAQKYTETATGDVIYRIEPFLEDTETYTMEVDITVQDPADPSCFPVIYFRGKPTKKMGFYSNGTHTCLVNQNRGGITDVDAESTMVYAKQHAGERYHVWIESGVDHVTVKINGNVIYRDMQLSDCLSGDFSNLPAIPEIVCIQGMTGTTRTEIENLIIKK